MIGAECKHNVGSGFVQTAAHLMDSSFVMLDLRVIFGEREVHHRRVRHRPAKHDLCHLPVPTVAAVCDRRLQTWRITPHYRIYYKAGGHRPPLQWEVSTANNSIARRTSDS